MLGLFWNVDSIPWRSLGAEAGQPPWTWDPSPQTAGSSSVCTRTYRKNKRHGKKLFDTGSSKFEKTGRDYMCKILGYRYRNSHALGSRSSRATTSKKRRRKNYRYGFLKRQWFFSFIRSCSQFWLVNSTPCNNMLSGESLVTNFTEKTPEQVFNFSWNVKDSGNRLKRRIDYVSWRFFTHKHKRHVQKMCMARFIALFFLQVNTRIEER